VAAVEPTVFVVDDEEPVRDSLRYLIESKGLRVETYGSAEAFLENYRKDRPGCLLLDLRMPGMSGLELQAHLAREGCRIPIIILTGHGDVASTSRALSNAVAHMMEKPFDPDELLQRIRDAIDCTANSAEF
jgi:two-component system response regulator FixJ